ncbi:MAG: sporulation peptidase YabG [Bacillota bacterium]
MAVFNIGDIVVRKSHGQDIYFTVIDILNKESQKPVYVLRGVFYRIEADASEDDLIKEDYRNVRLSLQREVLRVKRNTFRGNFINRIFLLGRPRQRPGKILHIDSSKKFLNMCRNHYREAGIRSAGYLAAESEQPQIVGRALAENRPDILVVTGHDGIRKNGGSLNSLESYRNSKYFVECVKEARRYEPDFDKLCIFAGACQSYYEAIMEAGANFASSPGRININALDPAIVSEKVALTDKRYYVTPQEIARITITGSEGIGGINTRGHLTT